MADTDNRRQRRGPGLEPGARVGRYVVRAEVGSGGMGRVYAAKDPHLDRRVAIKLLHMGDSPSSNERRRERLRREAQALAQLNHPNVVTVHDVGPYGERMYIAMELIEGISVHEWLQTPRSWNDVLSVFVAAGRGLAAAHRAGLVHRDFKPRNVMLAPPAGERGGRDGWWKGGRVLVTDFGLVRATDTVDSEAGTGPIQSETLPAQSHGLTRDGALLGTPAYCAPETLEGHTATTLSDQFSFAVALYEGLAGRRPFRGETTVDLLTSMRTTKPPWPNEVPARVRRAVSRAMSPRPKARFETMDALLDELQVRRGVPLAAAAMAAAALGAVAFVAFANARQTRCAADGLATIWNDEREEAIATALGPVQAAGSVVEALSEHATQWQGVYASVCEGAGAELDLQMACLERAAAELDGLVTAVTEGAGVDAAQRGARSLAPPQHCLEPQADAETDFTPVQRAELKDLTRDLARIDAQLSSAKPEDVERTKAAVARAEALGHDPTTARAYALLGLNQIYGAPAEDAEASFKKAIDLATASGADRVALMAWAGRIKLVGAVGGEARCLEWLPAAQAALERADAPPEDVLDFHYAVGMAAVNSGDVDLGEEHLQKAAAIARESVPTGKYGVLHALGQAHLKKERLDEAEAAFSELLHALGDTHPATPYALEGLAAVANARGKPADAEEKLRRALEFRVLQYGPRSHAVAISTVALGEALDKQGKHKAAIEAYRDALAMLDELDGSRPRTVVQAHMGLARAHRAAGELETAGEHASKARVLAETEFGPDHPLTANAREQAQEE